jgi:hypothetical protein
MLRAGLLRKVNPAVRIRQDSSLLIGGVAFVIIGGLLQLMSNSQVGTGVSAANWFTKNFYDGGFQEKMTRREAALILGVRESATAERVKEAHRRVLLQNHPDRGGSPFIAAKVNEAKEFLLKGK